MASTAILAQGTLVKIATGTGGAKNISGVTLGNPTIITATSHGFSNGDVVTIASVGGTTVVNGTWTVLYKTTNTFAIALDTTGGSAYTSGGTATPTTYTAIANVRSFSQDGGSVTSIDKTNFDSAAKEFSPGLVDYGQISFEVHHSNADAGQAAVEAARAAQSIKSFKVILPSGTTPTATFDAFVLKFSKSGSVDGIVTGTIDLKITGSVAWS